MKLMRTLLVGEAEGVCSGLGRGVTDSSGHIEEAGDSSGIAEGVGVGDSCAAAIAAVTIHIAIIRSPQSVLRDSNIITPV